MKDNNLREDAKNLLQMWFITMKQFDEYPSRIPTVADAMAVIHYAEKQSDDFVISTNYMDYC